MAHLDALNEVHDRMGIELCETGPWAGSRFVDGSMVGPAGKRAGLHTSRMVRNTNEGGEFSILPPRR